LSETQIVGISGPSGSGKTTLTKTLAEMTEDSIPVFFDEYDAVTTGPDAFNQWLVDGADYNAWQCNQLASDLLDLKSGRLITHPVSRQIHQPASTILFDAPLGYANDALGDLIDTMVYLDTPLDIAMARRLIRGAEDTPGTLLASEMQDYLAYGRKCYLVMDRVIKPACNHVVDGSLGVDVLARRIISLIGLETKRV
jgi:uridine kinase